MKVILLKDIAGVGQKGSVKHVTNGYAMNYLIPQRLAEAASEETVAMVEARRRDSEVARERERIHAEETARHLEGAFITVRATANDEGTLYRTVSPLTIALRIKAERGVEVPESSIVAHTPIKSLGRAEVHVHLGERRVPVTVSVEREQ